MCGVEIFFHIISYAFVKLENHLLKVISASEISLKRGAESGGMVDLYDERF